jgi:thiosulfate/3-mercaptopyruvate sulfurtransferase
MPCFECHSSEEMHGELGEYESRYADRPTPSCIAACHTTVSAEDEIDQHTDVHLERLACQVCHSIEYKNCYSCHVQLSEDGTPFFRTEPSEMAFRIGRNPIQSEARPWDYVVVRHVPISRDSFEYYGDDLLPNFNNRPTWTYATPHNIQRQTPQNSSCDACHGNPAVFLTEDDVDPTELEANQPVIVDIVP